MISRLRETHRPMSKPALGRGLSALLGGKPSATSVAVPGTTTVAPPLVGAGEQIHQVAVDRLRPSSLQPRRDFPAETLRELADSIREQGILQPLVARPAGEHFELIAGERRWRAARLAGLLELPVIVREADDATALELMLVENLQREDLNPMDEAQGYQELMDRFELTQEVVAGKVGRSRAAVANTLRLLRLPEHVQGMLRTGRLSVGHAKVILGLDQPELQRRAAERVATAGLSVRQAEELVRTLAERMARAGDGSSRASPPVAARDPHVVAVEDRLRQRLGTKVTLRYREGQGQIDIRFFSDAELERVLQIVGVEGD